MIEHQWAVYVRTGAPITSHSTIGSGYRGAQGGRSKMSDSKQGIPDNVISVRGSSVRCESECNLDSNSFGRQA